MLSSSRCGSFQNISKCHGGSEGDGSASATPTARRLVLVWYVYMPQCKGGAECLWKCAKKLCWLRLLRDFGHKVTSTWVGCDTHGDFDTLQGRCWNGVRK